MGFILSFKFQAHLHKCAFFMYGNGPAMLLIKNKIPFNNIGDFIMNTI